jgi:surface protein
MALPFNKSYTMSELFKDLKTFNEDISEWEVGEVTDMSFIFFGASSFNQDLFQWNTSSVTTMKAMFENALAFDGNIFVLGHVCSN